MKGFLAFIFVLGIIIIVHETGHFVVAKLNKIRVNRFSIGFGPKIINKKFTETEFTLGILPFGGYVDLNEDNLDITDSRAFNSKKPIQKFLVVIAGAIMNFVLAYIIIFSLGVNQEVPITVIDEVLIDSPAYEAGIKSGDEIISINDDKIKYWFDIVEIISFSDKNSVLEFDVLRDDDIKHFKLKPEINDENRLVVGIKPKLEKDFITSVKYSNKDFFNKFTMLTDGFKKTLKLVGTGYRVKAQGKGVELSVGYSHPVNIAAPEGVEIKVEGQDTIHISGYDKQKVGQTAAEIRKVRPPEPYKGKGIRYEDEVVRRKQGKAAA